MSKFFACLIKSEWRLIVRFFFSSFLLSLFLFIFCLSSGTLKNLIETSWMRVSLLLDILTINLMVFFRHHWFYKGSKINYISLLKSLSPSAGFKLWSTNKDSSLEKLINGQQKRSLPSALSSWFTQSAVHLKEDVEIGWVGFWKRFSKDLGRIIWPTFRISDDYKIYNYCFQKRMVKTLW